jgi:uncharacterized protein
VKECRIIGLDVDRKRISLSCKTAGASGGRGGPNGGRDGAGSSEGGARRVVVAKRSDGASGKSGTLVADSHAPGARPGSGRDGGLSHDRDGRNGRQDGRGGYNGVGDRNDRNGGGRNGGYSGQSSREDDGMTYNPFAALLKDKKK